MDLAEKMAPIYYELVYVKKTMALKNVPEMYKKALAAYKKKKEKAQK